MADREKVIKGLNSCSGSDPCVNSCPYYDNCGNNYSCTSNLAKDALALLKEQDDLGAELTNAVELIHKKNERIKELLKEQEAVPVIQRKVMHMLVWCCSSCGVAITDGDKFCRNCGKKMKWDA